MNIDHYTIGLSLLSSGGPPGSSLPGKERLSAEGRSILSLLDGKPLAENDILREGQGRPYFADRHADFNISHSGAMAAVSLVRAGPDTRHIRIGCDVQLVRPRANAAGIAERFFSPAENDFIFSGNGGQCSETNFFTIWVLKECYLKLKGLSVFDMAGVPSFIGGSGPLRGQFCFDAAIAVPVTFNVYELAGSGERYMLACAIEGSAAERPVMQWFSHSRLSAKSIAEINAAARPAVTVRPNM